MTVLHSAPGSRAGKRHMTSRSAVTHSAHRQSSRHSWQGQPIWRLCKVYGRIIGYPELKPHDLRHGVAMEVLEQHHDLEQVRALIGHARIDTTQVYAHIRPPELKRVVSFCEEKAVRLLRE